MPWKGRRSKDEQHHMHPGSSNKIWGAFDLRGVRGTVAGEPALGSSTLQMAQLQQTRIVGLSGEAPLDVEDLDFEFEHPVNLAAPQKIHPSDEHGKKDGHVTPSSARKLHMKDIFSEGSVVVPDHSEYSENPQVASDDCFFADAVPAASVGQQASSTQNIGKVEIPVQVAISAQVARVLSRAGEDISNFRLYEDDDETLYSSYAARMVGSVRMESRDLGLVKNLLSAKQQAEISDEELLMGLNEIAGDDTTESLADLFQSLNISAADTVSVATFRAMHKNGLRRGPLPSFRKTPPFSQSKSESIKSSGDIKASMTSSAVETFGFDTCDLEEGFEGTSFPRNSSLSSCAGSVASSHEEQFGFGDFDLSTPEMFPSDPETKRSDKLRANINEACIGMESSGKKDKGEASDLPFITWLQREHARELERFRSATIGERSTSST